MAHWPREAPLRRALIIGIDHYDHLPCLSGCVNDAQAVDSALSRNADGTVNFQTRLQLSRPEGPSLSRSRIKSDVVELFGGDGEISLLYFAGHGHIETTGGYLCAQDCERGDEGLPLAEILTLANRSRVGNKLIILDSCHSGIAGAHPHHEGLTEISEGVTILTASTAEQYANEKNGSGVFTNLLINALAGEASNLLGEVTPGSVYAHIDQSLGAWTQRPVFKTNVKKFVCLRKVDPPIELTELRKIATLFPREGHEFPLDPTFEPERSPGDRERGIPDPDPDNTAVFGLLQKFNRLNLLEPVEADHMWHAAMGSTAVRLTLLGEHYRRLAARGLI